jgi:pimeloyl-ACP methyl ester carboxylesterase
MPTIAVADIEICYESYGDPDAPPILLVMGLGAQMTLWPTGFVSELLDRGFRVIRFDNRDAGLSTKTDGPPPDVMAMYAGFIAGQPIEAPYTLSLLASDAIGLLDALEIPAAHVVGASMGGMIVQTMAIAQPSRVRSLTSIMSTLGKRSVGWQHPSLLPILVVKRGPGREAYVASSARVWQAIGSPAYPVDDETVRSRAEETFDRGVSASGVMRQMLAVLNQPDRSKALKALRMPVAIVHGSADKMVHVSGGRATARVIPGAELLVIDGMGHDMPTELFETYTEVIRRTADRARESNQSDRTA